MEQLADFIRTLIQLIEAEFAEIRSKVIKTFIWIGICTIAMLVMFGGFALALVGIYLALALFMPLWIAAFVDAILCFIIAAVLLLFVKTKVVKRKEEKNS